MEARRLLKNPVPTGPTRDGNDDWNYQTESGNEIIMQMMKAKRSQYSAKEDKNSLILKQKQL